MSSNTGSCYSTKLRDKHFCVENSMRHNCPICYEIAATIMPEDYRYKVCTILDPISLSLFVVFMQVWILCNDCNDVSEVYFHIVGHKCSHCLSYNTRTIANPPPVSTQ
ncbi:hypothetical protein GW17_00000021 [Ensete ventricosum]|nr:hypothetical protein GW17_00000021 [Ensete ventricosum]